MQLLVLLVCDIYDKVAFSFLAVNTDFYVHNYNWSFMAVAVDADGSPVSVSWSGDSRRNVIVWMDHRAIEQAERINSSDSPVLQYCGGALSPEMEPPKVSSELHHLLLYVVCLPLQNSFFMLIPDPLFCSDIRP